MVRFSRLMMAVLLLLLVCSMAMAAGTPAITARKANPSAKLNLDRPDTKISKASGVRMNYAPKAWNVLLSEDFESGTMPATWTIIDNNADGYMWQIGTAMPIGTNPPNGGTYFAMYDDDAAGSGTAGIEELILPAMYVSGYESLYTRYDFAMQDYNGAGDLNTNIRTFTGGVWGGWNLVINHTADLVSSDSLDLTAYLPADSVQIEFAFDDGNDWGWGAGVDNVVVGGSLTPMALDVRPQSIDTPATAIVQPGIVFHGTWTIRNAGTDPASDFTTHYNIYDSTGALLYGPSGAITTPDTLAAGATRQFLATPDFTPDSMMWYQVEVITDLAGDLRPDNDTLRFNFRTFDELVGKVTDDNNGGAPLAGVDVTVAGPDTFNTTTDGSGNYTLPNLTAGTYDFTCVLAGYATETVTGVAINDNMQNTQNIAMGYPVLSYGPMDSMYVSLDWGTADSTTWDLTLNNTGTRDLHYSISWPETVLTKAGSKGPVEMVLDDGSRENDIGIGGTSAFMFLNRFTPDAAAFPFFLNEVQVYFSTAGAVAVGDSINIVIYENTSGNADPAVGSNWLYSYQTTVQALDAFNSYILPAPVLLNGPGDVLISVIGLKIPGTSYWPASMDETTTQARSWAGWWTTPAPPSTEPTLPPDGTWTLIDAYFPGNWMVRGYGASANAPWLNITPYTGTIGASNSHILDVAFNSAGYDSFTTWGAKVQLTSDGEIAKAQYMVPAFMHVLGMTGVEGKPADPAKPTVFALNASYPNPAMNGNAAFKFALPRDSRVSISVYNVFGQKVKTLVNGSLKAGYHSVNWNGKNENGQAASAGVYLYQMKAEGFSATRKMVVLH